MTVKVIFNGEELIYIGGVGATVHDMLVAFSLSSYTKYSTNLELRDKHGILINKQLPLSYAIGPGETMRLTRQVGHGG